MHYNITYEFALEIAEQFKKTGSAFLGDEEVTMVLPVKSAPGRKTGNKSKRLQKKNITLLCHASFIAIIFF